MLRQAHRAGEKKPLACVGSLQSAAFKARLAQEAIRGEKTVVQIAAHHELHATKVTAWKTALLENAAKIFGRDVLAADGK